MSTYLSTFTPLIFDLSIYIRATYMYVLTFTIILIYYITLTLLETLLPQINNLFIGPRFYVHGLRII